MKSVILLGFILSVNVSCFAMEENCPTLTLVSKDKKKYSVPLGIALQAGQIKELLSTDCEEMQTRKIEFKDLDSNTVNHLAQVMWFIDQNKALKKKDLIALAAQKFSQWSLYEVCDAWRAGDLLSFPYLNEFTVEYFAQTLQRHEISMTRVRRTCGTLFPTDKRVPLIQAIEKRENELKKVSRNLSRPPVARRSSAARYEIRNAPNPQPVNNAINQVVGQAPYHQRYNAEDEKHHYIGNWPCYIDIQPFIVMCRTVKKGFGINRK